MGRFATGVTVVTAIRRDGGLAGVTASAFTSLSLIPPLVSVCLSKDTMCLAAFADGDHFAVNILAEEQKTLSENFARRTDDKFKGVNYRTGANGCPLLPDCLAAIECRREAVHDAGDHVLIVGRVERMECSGNEPLIYFRGTYRALGGTVD